MSSLEVITPYILTPMPLKCIMVIKFNYLGCGVGGALINFRWAQWVWSTSLDLRKSDRQSTHLTCVLHRNIMKMLTVRGCSHNCHTYAYFAYAYFACNFITWCKLPCLLSRTWRLSTRCCYCIIYVTVFEKTRHMGSARIWPNACF